MIKIALYFPTTNIEYFLMTTIFKLSRLKKYEI